MNATSTPSIGVAIITHNAKHLLQKCLAPLLQSSLPIRILVVNSSSGDGTVELAQQLGADTLIIPRNEFNHGSTREKARRHLQTDIIGMLTPDAHLADPQAFHKLIHPIITGQAAAVYARQIPHVGADFFEAFPREFNYPSMSHTRSFSDLSHHGVYTFFFSNSCAAYSNAALESIGGFTAVLLGEDTVAVSKLLRRGYHIAYVAEALVHHSHRYSLTQEFRRSFDTGLARKQYAELLQAPKGDFSRGLSYVQSMIKRLACEAPHKIPYAFIHVLAKWSGYSIGKYSINAPIWFKKALSSQDFYWITFPPS